MITAAALSIGVSISEPVALDRVMDRIGQEGGRALPLLRPAIRTETARDRIAAFIYDMEPGDGSALDLFTHVHAVRPEWPAWLYYAPRTEVIERVAEVAWLPRVWATPQAAGPLHETEIRLHVRRLLTSIPSAQLIRTVNPILRSLPVEISGFLEATVAECGRSERGPLAVGDLARSRRQLRYIERVCQARKLPGPKRLLDHMVLAFVTFKTFAVGMPLSRAAEQAGLSPKAWRRLCHRLLPDGPCTTEHELSQFEVAIMAFATACQVPRQAADTVVEQAIKQRPA